MEKCLHTPYPADSQSLRDLRSQLERRQVEDKDLTLSDIFVLKREIPKEYLKEKYLELYSDINQYEWPIGPLPAFYGVSKLQELLPKIEFMKGAQLRYCKPFPFRRRDKQRIYHKDGEYLVGNSKPSKEFLRKVYLLRNQLFHLFWEGSASWDLVKAVVAALMAIKPDRNSKTHNLLWVYFRHWRKKFIRGCT